MDTQLIEQPITQAEAGALVVLVFEDGLGSGAAAAADQATAGWIRELIATAELTGKLLETASLPRPAGLEAKKLFAVGAGRKDAFTPTQMRNIAGVAVRQLKPAKCSHVALALDAGLQTMAMASAAVEGAILGQFEPDQYKTSKKDAGVTAFSLVAPATAAVRAGIDRGRIIGESQNFTRTLINEPPNVLTPQLLAARAKAMATEAGLDCDILGADRMKQLGMGALLGVAQGSAEPPALIVIRYNPGIPGSVNLGLVGKGVTFDTGGISIKPADSMDRMKSDMSGAAAVLGAMRAIAQLKPAIPVTALIPTVENMPGSRAQRPGDIVKTMNGKTVDVLNTDAEGRLILSDAIEYAKRLGCTHLVDVATLTGAIVVALGHIHAGVFTNNDELGAKVLSAAKSEGEKMWPMPVDDEYKDLLKSYCADLSNIGGRWGGACSAAMFLKEFADPTPWVHLDIAGTAWIEDAKPYLAKGPTGICVRTFVNLAMGWS